MSDFKLDPVTGDLAIENGEASIVRGVEAITQHLIIRLSFFLGEWFLNLSLGMPYYQEILVKSPRTNIVRRYFRDAILNTPGVLSITDLLLDYDPVSRKLGVSFKAKVTDSEAPLLFDEEIFA